MITYNLFRPWETLDPWQIKYIATEGNCFLLCGRQSGKSVAMSIKAAERALRKPNAQVMILAFTERQAYEIFFKTLNYLEETQRSKIKRGKDRPSKHDIHLKNGSKIMCYPTGQTGEGIRGFTVTDLFVDEARKIAQEVFTAITPMLSVTGGTLDISSTPAGKQGYFYDCSKRDDMTKFYVSAEDCPRHKKDFLEGEKKNMSELMYAQEYLAIFLDELKRFFSDDLLKKAMVLRREGVIITAAKYYLGVDIARLGKDEGTYEIIKKISKDKFKHVESIITKKKLTTETEQKIIDLHKEYNFREIDIDAGAGTLGVSVMDHLLDVPKVRDKVIAINNRARGLDRDGKKSIRLIKEDLYDNLRGMLERGELKLLKDDEVYESLASVQYEYVVKEEQPTRLKIYGTYTHVAEGLIRAAWAAKKDKSLNIWVR